MSGEFCTACGARSATNDAAPAAGPPPPAPRKTSPIVWILFAVLGLFALGGIAVVGGGLFLVHKARHAGFDADLMRNNPGLATAKLLVATNPDLEVVSSDDGRGLITIRQKSTGKAMMVTFDDMKRGGFTFREDGKDPVTLDARGNGDTGSLQMKSGSESLTMGANPATLPAWIPTYPNSKPTSTFSMKGKESSSASFQFQTQDAPRDVVAFYQRRLRQAGFRITNSSTTDIGDGFLSGNDAANHRTVMVAVTGIRTANVSVTYSQK